MHIKKIQERFSFSRLLVQTHASEPPIRSEVALLLDDLDDSPAKTFHVRKCINPSPVLSLVINHILNKWPKQLSEIYKPFW